MESGINIRIIFNGDRVTIKNVESWFTQNSFFVPREMRCKYLTKSNTRKFKYEQFFGNIKKELDGERVSISVVNDKNELSLNKGSHSDQIAWLTYRLTSEIYEENKDKIVSYVDDFMKNFGGITARICSLNDFFWQNNENLLFYSSKGKSLEGIHTKRSPIFPDDIIVDIEFNPGHDHIIDGICFTSCWTMWFGQEFFSYIPKSILKNYEGCYENKEISEGLIRIMLYENIWAYDEPDNRERQLQFRRQVGIDEVAHSYLKQRDRRVTDNPAIEINSGNFEHGGIRLLTYYYDAEEILVEKSKAVVAKTYELDEKGKTVWETTKNLK